MDLSAVVWRLRQLGAPKAIYMCVPEVGQCEQYRAALQDRVHVYCRPKPASPKLCLTLPARSVDPALYIPVHPTNPKHPQAIKTTRSPLQVLALAALLCSWTPGLIVDDEKAGEGAGVDCLDRGLDTRFQGLRFVTGWFPCAAFCRTGTS